MVGDQGPCSILCVLTFAHTASSRPDYRESLQRLQPDTPSKGPITSNTQHNSHAPILRSAAPTPLSISGNPAPVNVGGSPLERRQAASPRQPARLSFRKTCFMRNHVYRQPGPRSSPVTSAARSAPAGPPSPRPYLRRAARGGARPAAG